MRTLPALYDLLPEDVREWWDGHDYRVFSPVSLGDPAEIRILLRREDGGEKVVDLSPISPDRVEVHALK